MGNALQTIWDEVKSWVSHEFSVLSTAEIALLKSEIPTLTAAGAKAVEDFVIQAAQSYESSGLTGVVKYSNVSNELKTALKAGLTVIGGPTVQSNSLSQTLLNALVEAGATAAKIGVASLL